MSTFYKSHFIRRFTGKVPRPSLSPEPGHTLCASMRSPNALQHFTRATLNGKSQVKCRRPEAIGPHFVRACAVERPLHFNTCHESHFVRKFTGKVPQTRLSPERGHILCASHFTRKFIGKRRETRVSTLIKHRPLQLPYAIRTPQCGHAVWGMRHNLVHVGCLSSNTSGK